MGTGEWPVQSCMTLSDLHLPKCTIDYDQIIILL